MGAMLVAPYLIASLIALAGFGWAVHLAVDPEPFATSSAAAIAVGLIIFTLIAVTGILLVRARWMRGLALTVVAVGFTVGIITGFDTWAFLAGAFSLAAVIGLVGPWLDVWLRRRPTPDGPAAKTTTLVLGTLALVPVVGFAAPGGLEAAHVVLAVAGVVLAWAYTRAWRWALWGLRLLLPVLVIWAGLSSPRPGALLLALWGAMLVWLAWSREAARAVAGPPPPLPAPRPRRHPAGSPEGGVP
jgi:hypothetical protein